MLGQKIGKYEISEKKGEGGFGSVYRAWDCDLQREVAIKFMHRADDFSDNPKRNAFREEIHRLAAMDIPGAVHLYDAGEVDGMLFFVMEYVHGETIDSYCRNRTLSLLEKIALFLQVAEAVQRLHNFNIIHRDLKAANIMVDLCGMVKILDFGIALSLLDPANVSSGRISGSLGYLPPEMFDGVYAPSEASDIYALGILLYLIVTGEMPFCIDFLSLAEAHEVQLATTPPPMADFVAEPVPPRLEQLFRSLIAAEPESRPSIRMITSELVSILRYDFTANMELDVLRRNYQNYEESDSARDMLIVDAALLDQAEKVYCFNRNFLSDKEQIYILQSLRDAGHRSSGVYWLWISSVLLLFYDLFRGITIGDWSSLPGSLVVIGWFLVWIWRLAHRKPLCCYSRFSWGEEALEMLIACAIILAFPHRNLLCCYPLFFFYFAERIRLFCVYQNYKRKQRLPVHLNWYQFWGNWPLATSLAAGIGQICIGSAK